MVSLYTKAFACNIVASVSCRNLNRVNVIALIYDRPIYMIGTFANTSVSETSGYSRTNFGICVGAEHRFTRACKYNGINSVTESVELSFHSETVYDSLCSPCFALTDKFLSTYIIHVVLTTRFQCRCCRGRYYPAVSKC